LINNCASFELYASIIKEYEEPRIAVLDLKQKALGVI
jgi:hypothetical protein